jgi:hypothetical protein
MKPVHKALITLTATALLFALSSAAWYTLVTRITSIELIFDTKIDGATAMFNQAKYANPGGDGTILIRDFRFFLSNIELLGSGTRHVVPDSYTVLRYDETTHQHVVTLKDIPNVNFDRIRLGIGVDPATNKSLKSLGDLNPNGRMAWNWSVGYKFVLLEGLLKTTAGDTPLVYHIGFDENYTIIELPLPEHGMLEPFERLTFDVLPLQLFTGEAPLDILATPSIKFDRTDARRVATQFRQFIAPPHRG